MLSQIVVHVEPSELRIRTPRAHALGVLAGAAFGVVGLSMLLMLRPVEPFQLVLGVALIVLGLALTRAAMRGGVVLTRSELVEYGDLRRHTYDTSEIDEFFVDRTPHVVPWYSLWVRLSTTDVQPLQQVRILAMGQDGRDRLTDAAATATRWLRAPG